MQGWSLNVKSLNTLNHNDLKSLNVTQHINRSKDKKHVMISLDEEETFDKIQHTFMIKAVMKLRIEGIALT
jgi:hypothetical protein